eukprot:1739466-Pyramimonas_sp.AAC.1
MRDEVNHPPQNARIMLVDQATGYDDNFLRRASQSSALISLPSCGNNLLHRLMRVVTKGDV